MTHISKQKIDAKQLSQLFNQMNTLIAVLDTHTSQNFFEELLGPEEQIMIAKRLAAITMYIEGNSSYRVWQLLKISPSTAERIRRNYELGKYKHIETVLKTHKTDYEKFWRVLETILSAGLPPRGRGRWKSVFKHMEK